MENRGPLLIVFSLSLIASPLAIKKWEWQSRDAAPVVEVETAVAADAACESKRIETSSYAIGCQADRATADRRRNMGDGGALFVTATR